MNNLSCNVRREVLNSTYPALYVVFFSILEGNTREATWKEQHLKTLQITRENHDRLSAEISGLTHVRSISMKDQERFTSPWAVTQTDETKFEMTVSTVGRLLGDDRNLQALYHMLVMMTPSSSTSSLATRVETTQLNIFTNWATLFQFDPVLNKVQLDLQRLIYRYLTQSEIEQSGADQSRQELNISLMNLSEDLPDLSADEKTRKLISLVEDIHDCAEIMQNRTLRY